MKVTSSLAVGLALLAVAGVSEAAAPRGYLDGLTSTGAAHGWVVDPDTPSATVTVFFYLDGPRGQGRFIGSARAGLRRPDVNAALGLRGSYGFVFRVPSRYLDGRLHSLYAYGVDTGNRTPVLLSNSPRQAVLRGFSPPRPVTPPSAPAPQPQAPPAAPAPAAALVLRGNVGGAGVRVTGVELPNGVAATPSVANPILRGKNLYAPDLVWNGVWNCYYGGWRDERDVNDRIYFAVSDDRLPEGRWSGQHVVIDHGAYLHVNDPSVQRVGGRWTMAYTVARFVGADFRDWIAISTSTDGAAWTPNRGTAATEIVVNGRAFTDIARPSLVWTGSRWLLYFDGRVGNGPIHSYAARSTSAEPRVFDVVREYADVGGFPGFFEPDVDLIGGRYVAVVQRHFSRLVKLESTDGLDFREVGEILTVAHPAFGRRHVSNPGLVQDGARVHGVSFGMNDAAGLDRHDIGFAHTQLGVQALSSRGVWHRFAAAQSFGEAQVLTFGDASFTRLRVVDPASGRVLVDQAVASRAGDVWELRRR